MDNFIFNMFGMLVLFMFLVIIGGGISQWVKNNNSPRETVKARVVDKKSEVTYIQQEQNGMMTNTPQWSYYIVFEFENSDGKKVVKKMVVSGKEYKRICEGDCGDLTFQGTRYIGFEKWWLIKNKYTCDICGKSIPYSYVEIYVFSQFNKLRIWRRGGNGIIYSW